MKETAYFVCLKRTDGTIPLLAKAIGQAHTHGSTFYLIEQDAKEARDKVNTVIGMPAYEVFEGTVELVAAPIQHFCRDCYYLSISTRHCTRQSTTEITNPEKDTCSSWKAI